MKMLLAAALSTGFTLSAVIPASSSEQFSLDYRVERFDAGAFSIETCLDTAADLAEGEGLVEAARDLHPGELGVYVAGPAQGGSSVIVYCIGVGDKTAFVVQSLDYMRAASPEAAALADRLHQGLLDAAR